MPKALKNDAGVVDGHIIAAKNSIVMLGQDASIEKAQADLSNFLDKTTGSLDQAKAGAIGYVSSRVIMGENKRFIIDSTKGAFDIVGDSNETGLIDKNSTGDYYSEEFNHSDVTTPADLYIGENSALVIGEGVLNAASAIHFDKADAAILAGHKNAKVILKGDKFLKVKNLVIFSDNGGKGSTGSGNIIQTASLTQQETNNAGANGSLNSGNTNAQTGVKIIGHNSIRVESENGLFYIEYKPGTETNPSGDSMLVDEDKKDESFNSETSKPGQDFIGGVIDGIIDNQNQNMGQNNGNVNGNVDSIIGNDYITNIIGASNGKELEDANRFVAFGGVAEGTLQAINSATGAIYDRMNEPVYASRIWSVAHGKHNKLDDLSAQGISYGSELNLRGLSVGVDGYLDDSRLFLLGAAFHMGTGDISGSGAARGFNNDFKYFGGGVYGKFEQDNFKVLGDLSFISTDNDVKADNKISTLSASTKTQGYSLGLEASFNFDLASSGNKDHALAILNSDVKASATTKAAKEALKSVKGAAGTSSVESYESLNLVPYVGMRINHVKFDDLSLSSNKHGKVGSLHTDDLTQISVPVGARLNHLYCNGDWLFTNTLDLGAKFNFAGNSVDSVINYDGMQKGKVATESSLNDQVLFNAKVGFAAQSDSFKVDAAIGYAANSHVQEVSANLGVSFRY